MISRLRCTTLGGSRSGNGNRLVYHALALLEKLSVRLTDHVIATNQSYKMVEMQRGHVPEERITIVHNGPDLGHLRPTEPDLVLQQMGKTLIHSCVTYCR